MTTATPLRPDTESDRDGLGRLLHAEWTKFRTVRGWVLAAALAALVPILLGLAVAAGSRTSCSEGPVEVACPAVPLGPAGEAVEDRFFFVNRTLTGDGAITARVTSLTGLITYPPPDHDEIVAGVTPWAKAGLIVKDGTGQGAPYAAVMMTGEHGVRMQHDFTEDVAGGPGAVSAGSPRWLRLTRSGDTLTGEESADGTRWTAVGTAVLPGLPADVRIGLFVASPGDLSVQHDVVGGSTAAVRLAMATATFDQVELAGPTSAGGWRNDDIGAVRSRVDGPERGAVHHPGSVAESDGTFTVTGNGDIAPLGAFEGGGSPVEFPLAGAVFGLVAIIVASTLLATAEYSRGLIRTTLLASPRRGRVPVAKAVVSGSVGLVAGLVVAGVLLPLGGAVLKANGNQILPTAAVTEVRVVIGCGVLFAATAVLATGLGIVLRSAVAAVAVTLGLVVLPVVMAVVGALPDALAQWLLRLTPAAGFAVQQSVPQYPQVTGHYVPAAGYYPLPPAAGIAVLCGYAALAVGLAVLRIRRADA